MDMSMELAEIAATNRELAARIERLAAQLNGAITPVWDPADEPPVSPDPHGTRAQRDWCALVLWARLFAINAVFDRGASQQEVVRIAKEAGYADGRAWGQWKGREDREDGRWATSGGVQNMQHYYREVGYAMPDYLAQAAEQVMTGRA